MEKEVANYADELEDYLKANGTMREHSDMEVSGRRIRVWEIPESKKGEFMKLYRKCSTNWENRHDFHDKPDESRSIKLFCDVGEHDGPFKYRMAGYNFDGFYVAGDGGAHDCSSYVSCYMSDWYMWKDPWRYGPVEHFERDVNRGIETIIAFMPEKEKETK